MCVVKGIWKFNYLNKILLIKSEHLESHFRDLIVRSLVISLKICI